MTGGPVLGRPTDTAFTLFFGLPSSALPYHVGCFNQLKSRYYMTGIRKP